MFYSTLIRTFAVVKLLNYSDYEQKLFLNVSVLYLMFNACNSTNGLLL